MLPEKTQNGLFIPVCYNCIVTGWLQKISARRALLALIAIGALSFGLMLYASFTDSAIMDELAHIPAGYGYVHNLDYRLNSEHPPLIKALSALPLLFLNLKFPTESSAWTTDINGQWAMGSQFLYESGNDANSILRLSRMAPILLTILLVVLIYFWSRELLGNWWGLLPAFLFGLSPTTIAHGHYVTTDVAAAFGTILATYFFLKFLYAPSRPRLIYAGLAFGIAQISKFSAVLLIPYFAGLLFIFYLIGVIRSWRETDKNQFFKRFLIRAWHYIKSLIFIFAIGYIFIVYPVYFLFTVNYPAPRQAADTAFTLASFAGGPTPAGETCKSVRCLADLDIWMSKNGVIRPFGEYLLGVLMVVQRASGGNTSYFLGQVSAAGSRLYFPLVYLLKENLPALIMVITALIFTILSLFKKTRGRLLDYLELNFTEFSMFVFIIFYMVWSMKSPLNIGLRHLLPILPFVYILTSVFWKHWVNKKESAPLSFANGLSLIWILAKNIVKTSLKYFVLLALLLWFLAETIFAAPRFLSYFNEIGGGISGGYRYVTDSNYDWGQDLLRLQKFVSANPEIDKIAVDYFGGGSPKYYLGDGSALTNAGKAVNWQSSRGNPADIGIRWLAVSANTLEIATQPLAPGQNRNPEDAYSWLTALRPPKPGMGNIPEPDYRVGTSIFIYKL